MKSKLFKNLCVFLSICIITVSLGNVYASETNLKSLQTSDTNIKFVSNKQVNVTDENGLSKITILNETPYTKEVLIEESSGEKIVLTTNKANNTVHSSKTNKTLSINDISSNITFYATPHYGDKKVEKISFQKIKATIGVVSGIASIIGLIVSLFSGGTAAAIGVLISRVGGAAEIINLVNNGSPNHGFKITKEYTKRTSKKQGRTFTYGNWSIVNISLY